MPISRMLPPGLYEALIFVQDLFIFVHDLEVPWGSESQPDKCLPPSAPTNGPYPQPLPLRFEPRPNETKPHTAK